MHRRMGARFVGMFLRRKFVGDICVYVPRVLGHSYNSLTSTHFGAVFENVVL